MIGASLRGGSVSGGERRGDVLGMGDDYQVSLSSEDAASGGFGTLNRAITVPVVYAGIARIAESMRVMPMELRLRGPGGWAPAPWGLPLTEILSERPNDEQSAADLWELLVVWMLVRGNAYVWKQRDRAGRIIALWPIPPDRVQVSRDLRTRRKVFTIYASSDDPAPIASGTTRDLIHFRAFGPDPLRGLGVVEAMRELVGRSRAEEEYQSRAMQNQVRPSGVLEAPAGMSNEAMLRLATGWNKHAGSRKAGGTPILPDDVKWKGVSMSAADVQFIEQRQMTRQEWAMALRLPAGMLLAGEGGGLHYTSAAMDGAYYQTYTLLPWCSRIEDPLRDDPDLPWGYTGPGDSDGRLYPKFNATAFTRADDLARAQAQEIGVRNGWLLREEVRDHEGLVAGVELPPLPSSQPPVAPTPTEGGAPDART